MGLMLSFRWVRWRLCSIDRKAAHDKARRAAFDVYTMAKETAAAEGDPNVTDFSEQSLEPFLVVLSFNIGPLVGMELDGHGEVARRKDRGNGIGPKPAVGSIEVVVGALQKGADGSG